MGRLATKSQNSAARTVSKSEYETDAEPRTVGVENYKGIDWKTTRELIRSDTAVMIYIS